MSHANIACLLYKSPHRTLQSNIRLSKVGCHGNGDFYLGSDWTKMASNSLKER